jgi:hypothetical protein
VTPQLLIATTGDGLFGGVRDFFDSGVWLLIRNLTLFFVGVFYIATVFWVYKDARRRIEDPWMVVMATILGAIPPFLGPIIYLFFRPPEYLDDVRERELEIKAMEERLARRDLHCPVCRAEVDGSFLVCPVCTTKLKQACANCKAPLEALWQVCPFCERPVDSPTAVEIDSWEPELEPEPQPQPEPRREAREARAARRPRRRPE